MSGAGGEAAAIFRLDTSYGGGKTHGLIGSVAPRRRRPARARNPPGIRGRDPGRLLGGRGAGRRAGGPGAGRGVPERRIAGVDLYRASSDRARRVLAPLAVAAGHAAREARRAPSASVWTPPWSAASRARRAATSICGTATCTALPTTTGSTSRTSCVSGGRRRRTPSAGGVPGGDGSGPEVASGRRATRCSRRRSSWRRRRTRNWLRELR